MIPPREESLKLRKEKNNEEKDTKKMEPAQVAKTFERRWVKIGDLEYDVTDMKHPGGVGDLLRVVQRQRGRDGGVSESFTIDREKRKMLKCLPQRKYDAKSHYSS